ncbi:methyltransferase [Plasmodium brasilianum]|uniref:Methyltransferase, putative n=2 Tax=Plasmodium (Plasmodium) TaxID=418103 RepID=A0A1D3TFL8_PLAMA|nr:methyltransferase, putative [Plasmodium malariae]KAI4835168.1 methyltransferase [Plasmodium brasilianum]SCP03752.1 methyltransferase, putative [Plasmodium malariae]
MRPFFDSDIVVNFNLSEEAVQNEKRIIENNRRVLRDYQKEKLILEGKKNWDKFYNHYKSNFFKDRKWIKVEFDNIFKENNTFVESKSNTSVESKSNTSVESKSNTSVESKSNTSVESKSNTSVESKSNDKLKETETKSEGKLILEIGCGVGNSLIPLLLEYEDFNFIGIDFSKNAINILNDKWKSIVNRNNKLKEVQVVGETADVLMNSHKALVGDNKKYGKKYEKKIEKKNEKNTEKTHQNVEWTDKHILNGKIIEDHFSNGSSYDVYLIDDHSTSEQSENCSHMYEMKSYKKLGNLLKACVVDITVDEESSTNVCTFGTVDVILLIYVLSSVQPDKMIKVINNCYKYLKKGGYVLLRDYGLYDLTQVRFANKREKKISENFYVRGDKTFVYFFTTEYLHDLFCQNDLFEEVQNKYITRIVKNRKRHLEMKRIWVQSIFRKK